MKFKLLAGAALAAVFAATGAAAQVGWYGAADIGYHWPETMKTRSSTNNPAIGAPTSWDVGQKSDWAGFGRVGYQLTDHWRVEGELGYRNSDIRSIHGGTTTGSVVGLCTANVTRTVAAPGCGGPDGDVKTWSLMPTRSSTSAAWAWASTRSSARASARCASRSVRSARCPTSRARSPPPTRRSRTC